MKVSDYIAEYLKEYTKHVFCGNGGTVVGLLDSIANNKSITEIPCQNEQGAAIAAEAYSRVSGKLGVAIATSGPGMVNLIQGIACAYFDSIPVLYIVGAPPTNHLKNGRKVRQLGFQEMDVVNIVEPITKYAVLLKDPYSIKYELDKLIHTANSGNPGPVVLDIPDDLQRVDIGNPSELKSFISKDFSDSTFLISNTYDMLSLISKSERPVAIIGGGVKISHTEEEMCKFLKNSGIPFVTTWATVDLFHEDTLNLIGGFGVSSNRYGNFAVQNADLIINFGSRLDTHQTGSNPSEFSPKSKKISINIDHNEMNKNNGVEIDLKICCDLKEFLPNINTYKIKTKDLSNWKNKILVWKEKYPICLSEYYDRKDSVNPYVFMNELSKRTKDNDTIITDTGATLTWTMQAYKMRHKQKLFSAFNHSPMGYALPASIGTQYVNHNNRVICITGDGGMSMNIQELETVIHNSLPIKIFVMNNNEYGMIKLQQDTWLNSKYTASDSSGGLGFPDIVRVAIAYGFRVIEIDDHSEICFIDYVLDYDGPILCNIKIKPCEQILPKLVFGKPIEDMAPLLARDEIKKIMEN
jgi:acetolactate synthase-1/2/3 large subunit